MACSKESSTSKGMSSEEVLVKMFEKMFEKMDYQLAYIDTMCEKLSIIELRQSRTAGETNDSIRAFQQWACAESSCIGSEAVKTVKQMQGMNKNQLATYYEAFVQKDERRCEYELWKFYELVFRKNDFIASDSQHSTGECFQYMPSAIRKLNPDITEEELNKMIPEGLKLLYELMLPLNRAGAPMTTKMMIELQTVPKNYKPKRDQLTEDQAKHIWERVKAMCPECGKIEEIPVNDLHAKESWHQQLLRRVLEHNRFKKKVHVAEATAAWSVEDEAEATPEQIKAANDKHTKALDKYWSRSEPHGVLVIERAKELKKKWAKEPENDKAKKTKLEETKDEGDEEEQ
jgi:hypothetical protein